MSPEPARVPCPSCGEPSKKVPPETVHGMASAPGGELAWRFCRTRNCDLVYFADDGETRVLRDDLRVTVFQKSDDPTRLACYCFGHSVASIYDEVGRTGDSQVPASIAEKCRAGLDSCEKRNPQGSCCLGNVRAVVREAQRAAGTAVESAAPPCCDGSGPHD